MESGLRMRAERLTGGETFCVGTAAADALFSADTMLSSKLIKHWSEQLATQLTTATRNYDKLLERMVGWFCFVLLLIVVWIFVWIDL